MKKGLPSLLWGKQMPRKRTLQQISNRIYYVKRGWSAGTFYVGLEARGRKVKIELITPPPQEEESNARLTLKEVLKKEYNVIKSSKGSKVQVPLVLLGARVKVHFVN